MIKLSTVALSVALAAPFGLAIHEDLTRPPQPAREPADTDVLADSVESAHEAIEDLDDAPGLSEDALRRLLGPDRATWGPAFAGLRFGMTSAEVKEHAPEVASGELSSNGLGQVELFAEYLAAGETRLTALRMVLPDAEARAETFLRTLWGEPQRNGTGPDIWFNETTGTRAAAWLDDDELTIELSRAMNPVELIAPPEAKTLFGFAKSPLLGTTLETLGETLDENSGMITVDPYFREHAVLELPGVASDPEARSITRVTLGIKNNKVTSAHLIVPCGQDCASLMQRLTDKLEKPTTPAPDTRVFGTSPRVIVTTQDAALTIRAVP